MMKNGNHTKLFIGLGTARLRMLPKEVAKNVKLGELAAQRHMGMDLVWRLADRLGINVPSEFGALSAALDSRPDLYQECQSVLAQLETGKFILLI